MQKIHNLHRLANMLQKGTRLVEIVMMQTLVRCLVLSATLASTDMARAADHTPPPPEPPQDQVIEELFDNEAGLVIFTYSLNRDGVVDYVTGRKVLNWKVNDYGHGVYDMEQFPVFYWYDQALWRDMDSDGINGNETLYMEDVTFDRRRYR